MGFRWTLLIVETSALSIQPSTSGLSFILFGNGRVLRGTTVQKSFEKLSQLPRNEMPRIRGKKFSEK